MAHTVFEEDKFLVRLDWSIAQAIRLIDNNSAGIALIVDADKRLIGTVTDGDVRRAMLRHESLDAPVSVLLKGRGESSRPTPVTAPAGSSAADLLELMRLHEIRHIPVIDAERHVVDLALRDHLALDEPLQARAVVMAGGRGTRLAPLTSETPKPMLPVGDRPLMERLVGSLRTAGIRKMHVTTHFRPEKIREHFGDGEALGIELSYVTEVEPLGTAGSLRLVTPGPEPLVVVNGDILTTVNFRALIQYHQESAAILTIGLRSYEVSIPYGVVETEGSRVLRINEKPTYRYFVNAGIYVVEPAAIGHIPKDRRFDMTDLIDQLVASGEPVASFPLREYWLDVGRLEDYERAQRDIQAGTLK
jgi:dTDP-glucose pyrophosphorylase/CBS domain-containing protein